MDPIDEIFRSIQPHPSKAQILLEVEDERKALDRALRILEANGVQPIEYDFIRKGNPSFVRFYLSTNNIREAVLHLTQAGFTSLKGVNSKNNYPAMDPPVPT